MKKILLFTFAISSSILSLAQSFSLLKPDPSSTSFNGNTITDVLIDNNKVVCYTRGDSSLVIYDGTNWTYKGHTALGFSGYKGASKELAIAPNGDYWLAYFTGLDIFDGTSLTNMTVTNSELQNDFFTDLAIDNNGRTFIGYGNGFGISMIENGNWTHKGDFTGNLTPFNSVFTASFIEVNKQTNDTWILSGDNYYKLNNNSLTTYTGTSTNIPNSSASDVSGMAITDDGKVWFSLRSNSNDPTEGGILSFDGTNWVHFNTSNSSIPSNNITAISSYQNKVIFNHSLVSGISVFDGTNWTLYDGTNGSNFPVGSNYVIHDMKTLNNRVYMASNSGLFVFEIDGTVGIESSFKNDNVSIYPNPTNEELIVDSKIENLTIEVKNALGETINISPLLSNRLDVSSLTNGIYFISFFENNELIETKKFIKK